MTTPRSARALPRTAEVVVIGGGAIGTSIAFHLAEAGVPDVVLLERDELGQGSTCKAAGGVRAQFSDRINIELGARSLEAFGRFAERPGQEIDLHRVGYLFLLSTPAAVASFERDVALQNELGVPTRMIEVAEAEALSPLIETDGLLAAAYSPDDGHCTPESVVLGYAPARDATAPPCSPASPSPASTCTAARPARCTPTAVRSPRAPSSAPPERGRARSGRWWAPRCPSRRCAARSSSPNRCPTWPRSCRSPSTSRPAYYFHREGRGLLLGMSDPDQEPGFHLAYSDDWLPRLGAAIEARTPRLLDVGLGNGWAGLYEVTPDHNALIGRSSTTANVLYATGFSGHGFLQAPAVGEVVRDLHLDRTPFVDTAPLSADRFARDGAARPESHIV